MKQAINGWKKYSEAFNIEHKIENNFKYLSKKKKQMIYMNDEFAYMSGFKAGLKAGKRK